MSDLTGNEIKDVYKQFINIGSSNIGITSSIQYLTDGEGNASVLGLSNAGVQINAASITINGRVVTITNTASLSGTNTGDQTITLTGDITGSGTGSFAATIGNNAVTTAKIADANVTTAKIADGNVTYAKIQNVSANSILGNYSGLANPPIEIALGTTLQFSTNQLQTTALSGDLTSSANSFSATVAKINGVALGSTAVADGRLLVGDTASSSWITRDITGDVTINNSGVTAIGSGKVTTTMLNSGLLVPITKGGTGVTASDPVIQRSVTLLSTTASGGGTIPLDNTKPQNTEGNQFITCSITPKSASNVLLIEVLLHLFTPSSGAMIAALFQDSTADALCADCVSISNTLVQIRLTHQMLAGTTSATTFKVKAGCNVGASTTYFNTDGTGSALFGGILNSSIVITEYAS